jgi:AmmeMemoRadiSam system protein B
MSDIRPAAVAGTWYPGTRTALERAVDAHLAEVAVDEPCPIALVAPHAGLVYSGPVAAHAYQLVRRCEYEAIVMIGPSHFVGFDGASLWPRGAWDSPFGPVPIAETLAATIEGASALVRNHPSAHGREHSLEMQLPFIARLLPGVPIVPILMGYQTRATAEQLGDAVASAVRGRRVLLVASSDLSHYNDAKTAARMDAVVLRHVEALDPDALMRALEDEPAHACGGGPMVAVLRAARSLGGTRARVLRYADSGDVSGDKTAVVGYMAAAVW